MLLEAKNLSKQIGANYLFKDVSFSIMPGEKIALIGRNGHGKTTLLKMISGEDHDFLGSVTTAKGTHITLTKQEHASVTKQTPLEYVINSVPNYFEYKKVLEEYENGEHTNLARYLHVLDIFTEKKFFNLPDAIISTLSDFGIVPELSRQPLAHLSGGQKRYVEMTRMMFSGSDLLLVDEPTNHLDYLGKERFISWMNGLKQSIVVVSHDRDVLKHVDKIIELKDKKIHVFNGNFDHYTYQNSNQTMASVKHYQDQLNRLKEAKKKVDWGLRMRAKSKAWKIRYDHWKRDYDKIKAETVKPSFWIDQESIDQLDEKTIASYDKFKEKNISINIASKRERGIERLEIRDVALGYAGDPVFMDLTFSMHDNDRVFIKGRNGAGKSTLVRTILALSKNKQPMAEIMEGRIRLADDLRIGEYQQEIDSRYLNLSLSDAIRKCYLEKGINVEEQKIKSLLAQYLFNPIIDAHQKIKNLSGGQKARFQIITMLIDDPNLLILDEPTNHLDLPSIEELETALTDFQGAILYISHDTYFIKKMGGRVVELN